MESLFGKNGKINKSPVIGTWQTVYSPQITELLCDIGFEFITIDLEHSSLSLGEAAHMVQIASLAQKTALVRIGEKSENTIKRIMDIGADGVVVADIRTAVEARAVVETVHYPPKGKRGVGLHRAQKYGRSFAQYLDRNRESAIVIVQIEHRDAIDNLRDILSVEGITASIIGPYDMSGSFGCPGQFDSPSMKAALKTYIGVCKELDSPAGYHVVSSEYEDLLPYIEEGYRFLPLGFDMKFLSDICARAIEGLKNNLIIPPT